MVRRSNTAPQIDALRMLADELEAGTRELSPEMAKALRREVERDAEEVVEELSQDSWEEAWSSEIDARLEGYRAGTVKKQDLGAVLEELRARR